MAGGTLFTLSVCLSLITGTAAAILSLLLLEILQRSPFGRTVLVLSLVMAMFVVYHVTLLLSPGMPVVGEAAKSVMYTGVAVFIWIMVWSQYRMRHRTRGGVDA